MDEAEQLCDRLVVMDHGTFAAEGSPRELIERYCSPEILELRFDPQLSSIWSRVLGPLFYLGAMGFGLGSLLHAHGTASLGGVSYLAFVARPSWRRVP